MIFETAEGASNSIELLNKSCFESRRITAQLTFQGPTEGEAYKEPHESRDPPTSKAEPIVGPSRLTDDQLYGERSHHSKHNDSDKKRSSNGMSSSSRRTNPQSGKKSPSKKRSSLDKCPTMIQGNPSLSTGRPAGETSGDSEIGNFPSKIITPVHSSTKYATKRIAKLIKCN